MSRYFSRLAQRSGMHGVPNAASQSATTPASGGLVEVHRQSEALNATTASSYAVPATARNKSDSSAVSIPKAEHAATPTIPSQEENVKSASDQGWQAASGPVNERTHAVKIGDEVIKPRRMDNPNTSSADLTQETISWGQKKPVNEASPGHGMPEPEQNIVAEAMPLPAAGPAVSTTLAGADSEPTISMPMSYHYDQRALADAYPGISDVPIASIPGGKPSGNNHQGIEIHIGSVFMEVHEKQTAVASPPVQSEPKTDRNMPRPAESSSGFRPNRYYLRGV